MPRFLVGLLFGMSALWGSLAVAQPKWAVDQAYENSIDLGGVQLPLPSGVWRVTGIEEKINKDQTGHMHVAVAHLHDGQLEGLIILEYNTRTSRGMGWTLTDFKTCSRENMHYAKVLRDLQTDKACHYVNHIVFNAVNTNDSEYWKQTIRNLKAVEVKIPQTTIEAGFVVADRANYISVRYRFNPEIKGHRDRQTATWTTSDWNIERIARQPAKQAYVKSIVDWTGTTASKVETGLAGRLGKAENLDWPSVTQ